MTCTVIAAALGLLAAGFPASSHREAPLVTEKPKVDGTDFYMFRSYEPGREGFVTIVANYLPLQDPYGGPNYFRLDPDALYEIHVDNDGDAVEDLTFQFQFDNELRAIALPVGNPGEEVLVPVPLSNVGPFSQPGDPNLNVVESYGLTLVETDGGRRQRRRLRNADTGETRFVKPADNIGQKSVADYEAYAAQHLYSIALPGGSTGRLFVGQRKDPFVVNLGETFDLVNLNPLGPVDGEEDDLADKNVTSIVLELPVSFLRDDDPVVGAWTTASLRRVRVLPLRPDLPPELDRGPFSQVSRLSSPLVNEVVIGLPDKDRFNSSHPADDAQFAEYVTNPTLPELLQVLFGVAAPDLFPRTDLVAAFLTGIDGLNRPANVVAAEMLRLNTDIDPTPGADQSNLGVLGGDLAGFPNGRRPGDDVVDIELRVVMGALLDPSVAPDGDLPYTDGATVDAGFFDETFPYLRTPLPGSPQ